MESQAVRFGDLARMVANAARSLGLTTPVFTSPPRIVGISRTVRRRPDGQTIVSVAFRGRPEGAVVADMIEGIVIVNALVGAAASRARDDLWQCVELSMRAAA